MKKRTLIHYFKNVFFAAVVSVLSVAMTNTALAQQWNLDHFKVYRINPQPLGANVMLRNIFTPAFTPAAVNLYERFLNPLDKNHEGIIDPFSHLNWYNINTPPDAARALTINNQFGNQQLVIGPAEALLVPTEKVEPGSQFPAQLDHYEVYRVLNGAPANWPVNLRDQFEVEDNVALEPVYFAVPTEKVHNGQVFPVNNPVDYLVFYRIDPRQANYVRPTIDQFGQHGMQTIHTELIGVPSFLLDWSFQGPTDN